MIGLVLFVLFISLAILTVPIGVAIGLSAFLVMLLSDTLSPSFAARSIVSAVDSFPLLAVPLFLLAGEIMTRGGMSQKFFDLAHLLTRNVIGGIPMAVVLAALLFGALSGSGSADTAAIGSIMIPAMVRMGYPLVFSATLVAASGTLAVVMPPSLVMIVYGITARESIGDLFIAGIVPAFIMAASLMLYAHVYCRINGLHGDRIQVADTASVGAALRGGGLPMLLPVIILGGIYGGVFTPTEAAAVAVIYATVICMFVYRNIGVVDMWQILKAACVFIGPIMIVIAGATVFRMVITVEQIPQHITAVIVGITDNKFLFILALNVFLLICGMVIDAFSAIIIFTPLLLPVATALGIDPLHFGILMSVNLAVGYITPPLAGNLFIVASISGASFDKISRGILIPVAILFAGVLLVSFVPAISLFLPRGL